MLALFFGQIHPKYSSFDGMYKAVAQNWDESECLE